MEDTLMSVSKEKKTTDELGSELALIPFKKYVIAPLVKKCINAIEKNEKTWQFDIGSHKADKISLLKEWIFLEIFLFGQAVLAYFHGDETGKAIVNSFHVTCAFDLTSLDIFTPEEKFDDLLTDRYTYYLEALKEAQETNNNAAMVLAERIRDKISGHDGNLLDLLSIVQYYTEMSERYNSLFHELMEEISVVN